jgi:uncharacterized protein (TIGR03435 family)
MIELIKFAYHVQRYRVAGPDWFDVRRPGWSRLDAARYDVLAKAPGAAKEDDMRPMLQALLAERFHLTLHRETRTLPVLALVAAKGGHKMRVSQSDTAQDGKQDPQRGNIFRGASMEEMANELSDGREWDAAIVNATGLKGRFDFRAQHPEVHSPTQTWRSATGCAFGDKGGAGTGAWTHARVQEDAD